MQDVRRGHRIHAGRDIRHLCILRQHLDDPEGVNLPADNLFITSYYSGRAQMTDVDFRNLIGRVGRIQYNLSGNVFMVSDETRNNKQDVYLGMVYLASCLIWLA